MESNNKTPSHFYNLHTGCDRHWPNGDRQKHIKYTTNIECNTQQLERERESEFVCEKEKEKWNV